VSPHAEPPTNRGCKGSAEAAWACLHFGKKNKIKIMVIIGKKMCMCVRAVKRGDRVAQLILERICMADVMEVDELPETAR
jgi:hypothetical protein